MKSAPDDFNSMLLAARPMLHRFAMALCRDEVRADDLVQDAIVRAIANRGRFQIGTNFDAWMTTILRNGFRSSWRKRKREVEDPDSVIASAQPIEDDPTKRMEAVHMPELVEQLPEAFGVPLKMIAEGASYEEVAEEIHEHLGTVKSRVNRARQMIGAGSRGVV